MGEEQKLRLAAWQVLVFAGGGDAGIHDSQHHLHPDLPPSRGKENLLD